MTEERSGDAPRILLVEDDATNRDMLSRRLERRGFQVLMAVDGREGVDLALSARPDLILMDLSLPVLDGWSATRSIKSNPVTASIPVIALTAHAMESDRRRAFDAGCDEFDTKPVDFRLLSSKIDTLLARRPSGEPPS
ncbi:MAG: response regulator [Phycisphaerae bacterium]